MIKRTVQNFIKLIKNAERQKIVNLLIGVIGVYVFYFSNGYIHERMTKVQYQNYFNGQKEKFTFAIGFVIYPSIVAWIVGRVINAQNSQTHQMPTWMVAKAASMTVISQIVVNISIYLIDYPTSVMFKSCTIIAVLIVAIFCSKIKSKKLKLGPKKLITGGLITMGIIMYSLFRQADRKEGQEHNKQVEEASQFTLEYFAGIILLAISLVADGFLPDFQAQLKQKYTPRPLEMYEQMNKWTVIWCVLVSVLNQGQLYFMTKFLVDHPQAAFQMLLKSVTGAIGQMFVYKLIKDFKQHIVPFVVTTRKLFSVVISIIIFNHSSNLGQVIAIIIVFTTVVLEFLIEVGADEESQSQKTVVAVHELQQQDINSTIQIGSENALPQPMQQQITKN